MTTSKKSAIDSGESSSSTKNQVSVVKGFNLTFSKETREEWVCLYMENKDRVILDRKTIDSMRFARELKGATVEYKVTGSAKNKDGETYNKCRIVCVS